MITYIYINGNTTQDTYNIIEKYINKHLKDNKIDYINFKKSKHGNSLYGYIKISISKKRKQIEIELIDRSYPIKSAKLRGPHNHLGPTIIKYNKILLKMKLDYIKTII